VAYPQQQLVASNGVPPYSNWTWAPAPASALPPGLSLNMSSGIITGAPTAAGAFSFIVSVSDSLGATATQTYSITVIAAGPVIGTSSLPNGQYNSPYTPLTLSATSGNPALYMVAWIGWCFARGHDSKSVGQYLRNACAGGPLVHTDQGDGCKFVDSKRNSDSPPSVWQQAMPVTPNCYMPYPTTPHVLLE